ncbi:hypothetical protein [Prosthecomicrobium sp. N25]|uniref:hypothetical protein n=1 Tax=Prosthecomicrobium sp. N25 TaxID=3129254 RepID=UPI0030789AD6
MKSTAALAALALLATASAASAAEPLGCRTVGLDVDRDVIAVGKQEGRWTAVKLTVAGNDVEIYDLKIVYGGGKAEDFSVRSVIPKNGETRWIDLKGDGKAIRQIELVYRSVKERKGQAVICAYGR